MRLMTSTFSTRLAFQKGLIVVAAVCFLQLGLAMTTVAQEAATVTIAPGGIEVAPNATGVTFMLLRIAGPEGQIVCDQSSNGSPIQWSPPRGAQDGFYNYEVRVGYAGKQTEPRDETEPPPLPGWPPTESGTFLIEGGAIVPPVEEEVGLLKDVSSFTKTAFAKVMDFLISPVFADQVILDDLIVDGSECLGFDCINGESFGSDTLRLKENNLRIKFQDTSSSAGFPSNDWQLTANDSNSGGGNYFAIDDIDGGRTPFKIEAGAPSSALHVDDYGRIGVGTSIPVTQIHVVTSNTPTLRLEQDNSAGWGAQAWDLVGNESHFSIRDATNEDKQPFRIQPNTPTNTVYLKSDGNVGIGTSSPTERLHVAGNALISGNLELGSSRAFKKNIQPLEAKAAVDTLKALKPVSFNYKIDPTETSIGFIAEDVPDLVATNSRKSVSPMDIVAVLTKVIQEQQRTIDELSRRIGDLEKEEDGLAGL